MEVGKVRSALEFVCGEADTNTMNTIQHRFCPIVLLSSSLFISWAAFANLSCDHELPAVSSISFVNEFDLRSGDSTLVGEELFVAESLKIDLISSSGGRVSWIVDFSHDGQVQNQRVCGHRQGDVLELDKGVSFLAPVVVQAGQWSRVVKVFIQGDDSEGSEARVKLSVKSLKLFDPDRSAPTGRFAMSKSSKGHWLYESSDPGSGHQIRVVMAFSILR